MRVMDQGAVKYIVLYMKIFNMNSSQNAFDFGVDAQIQKKLVHHLIYFQ